METVLIGLVALLVVGIAYAKYDYNKTIKVVTVTVSLNKDEVFELACQTLGKRWFSGSGDGDFNFRYHGILGYSEPVSYSPTMSINYSPDADGKRAVLEIGPSAYFDFVQKYLFFEVKFVKRGAMIKSARKKLARAFENAQSGSVK